MSELTTAQAINNAAKDLSWVAAIEMCNEMVEADQAQAEQDWELGTTLFKFEDGTSVIFGSNDCKII